MARAIAAMGRGKDEDGPGQDNDLMILMEMNQRNKTQGSNPTKPLESENDQIKFDFLEFMNIYNLEKSGKHKTNI